MKKSGGYQIHISEVTTPEALEHLLLIVAIATVHWTSTGVSVVQAGKWRWVDAHWERGLSYLKISWRWHWQAYQRGWSLFSQWLCKQERFFRQIRFVSQTAIS